MELSLFTYTNSPNAFTHVHFGITVTISSYIKPILQHIGADFVHPGANGSISRSVWRVRDRGNTVTYMLGLITDTGQSAGLIIAKTILDQVWSH